MQSNNFSKFALVIVIVAAVTSSSFGQRWNNNNRYANQRVVTTQQTCINQITNLTNEQIEKITTLEEKHQAAMDEYRAERRSTFDAIAKDEVRDEMLSTVEAHQKEVKSLLSEDQQNQYALLHTTANPNYGQNRQFYGNQAGNNQNFVRGAGRGNNQSYVQGAGRGICYARAGRGNGRGMGNNQNFVRGNGNGNYANANNNRFYRGRSNRQGNAGYGQGRNANYGRGYGFRYNSIPTDTIEDTQEN